MPIADIRARLPSWLSPFLPTTTKTPAPVAAANPRTPSDVFEARTPVGPNLTPTPVPSFEGLRDEALLQAIRAYTEDHRRIGYDNASRAIFTDVDNENGVVHDIYAERDIHTQSIPSADGPTGANVEHSLPKSLLPSGSAGKSDLHHLFPTDSTANSRRMSYPFGQVESVKWENGHSRLGTDATGQLVFEPPPHLGGDLARARFYASATYGIPLPPQEEAMLRKWHEMDPPNGREIARSHRIALWQGRENPFVLDPSLVSRIADF